MKGGQEASNQGHRSLGPEEWNMLWPRAWWFERLLGAEHSHKRQRGVPPLSSLTALVPQGQLQLLSLGLQLPQSHLNLI